MHLNDQQLLNFVGRIKLPPAKKTACAGQIDALKDNVVKAINGMPDAKVTRVKRAGSWKKGTSLKPWGDNPVDVDMVFFVDVDDKTSFDAGDLRGHIIDALRQAYPQKSPADFTDGKKTVGLVFRGTGLEADIVPFIPDKGNSSYGRQPRKKLNSGEFRTSIDKQLDFVLSAKRQWPSFAPAVRMVKWWRNRKELDLPSFAVELLFAHLLGLGRVGGAIEDGLIEFFEFVSANPKMRVGFAGAIRALPDVAPVVADPTNNENNVLEKVSPAEWGEIVASALKAFETLSYARAVSRKSDTDDLWREVFDQFNTEEN